MEFPIRVVLQAAVCGDSRPNGDSNVRGAWSQLSKRSRAVFFTIQMFVEFFFGVSAGNLREGWCELRCLAFDVRGHDW